MYRFSKLAFGALFGVAVLGFASSTNAAQLTQAQIQSILSLLQSFGADQSTVAQVSATLGGTSTPSNSSCITITRQLTLGSTGDDVSRLQRFLGERGYLSAQPTGYYGFLTAQAVGKLQLAMGILTTESDSAYGILGPRTREVIRCNENNTVPPPPPPPVSATIYPNSLIANSEKDQTPVIFNGSVSGVPNNAGDRLRVTYAGQNVDTNGGGYATVYNGEWQWPPENQPLRLSPGRYWVSVTDVLSQKVLTTGTLLVRTVPTASIGSYEYGPEGNRVTVNGVAQGAVGGLRVFLAGYNYGSPAYEIMHGQLGKDGVYATTAVESWGGSWSATFPLILGELWVYVYDLSTQKLLATKKLSTVQPTVPPLQLCPQNAVSQRAMSGQTFKCLCPSGSPQRPIWGFTGSEYTDDSDICTAGAQDGQMNLTTGGEVYYMIKPGKDSYDSGTRHGIPSQSWGKWYGSFVIVGPKG